MEIIQIKCPWCSATLSVQNQVGIEGKNVTCPVCKHKSPFSKFKMVVPRSGLHNEDTEYPEEATEYVRGRGHIPGEQTTLPDENLIIGRLIVIENGQIYQLKPGRNVVGRKAAASSADFQIATGDNRRMSREHIMVEVKRVPSKGLVHQVSLFKEKVNPTKVGEEPLLYGDCVVLSDGDMISLPDATLRFEIPDDDKTDI